MAHMVAALLFVFAVTSTLFIIVQCACKHETEEKAKEFLKEFDDVIQANKYHEKIAAWNFASNLTDYNRDRKLEESEKFEDIVSTKAREAENIPKDELCNNMTRRELDKVLKFSNKNETAESKRVAKRLRQVIALMEGIYAKAKVCMDKDNDQTCLKLEPGLTRLMSQSRDEPILRKAWKQWRDVTGKKMKKLYAEYVDLSNRIFILTKSKYPNKKEKWLSAYGDNSTEFLETIEKLWEQARPIYQQLHSYVRRKLQNVYPANVFPSTGQIPAHLFGNMWAQKWNNLAKELTPFPNKHLVDVTQELVKQNYTVPRMFHTAEEFFTSLGLIKMTDEFWENSMIERPKDGRDVVCHGSAWDMANGKDFRIKMCTDITHEDFITIHHEMGHVEYYMQYSHLPYVFHRAANPGFHEAVGDTLALSVETIKHLKTIGLLDENRPDDDETDINFLMSMALKKIAFLPFGLVIDQWRWDVFSGKITPENYNKHWWNLRAKYQGISPPVSRSEEDFDPGAKYHVSANVPYIRYFVSYIVQFQFYEALCNATNHTGPLYKCDFYNNPMAGKLFSDMLKLGSSKPWQDALEVLTGSRQLDVGSLMRYFEPLIRYLKSVNQNDVGWDERQRLGPFHRRTRTKGN